MDRSYGTRRRRWRIGEFEFRAVNRLLQIKDKDNDIVMKSIRDNTVCPLWQPKLAARNRPNFTTTKPATKKKWHERLGHVNNNGLAKMPEMATGVSFLKDSTSTTEAEFCEAYNLAKQHQVYSKERPIDEQSSCS